MAREDHLHEPAAVLRDDDELDPGVGELLRAPAFVVDRFDLTGRARRGIFPGDLGSRKTRTRRGREGQTESQTAYPANLLSRQWNGVTPENCVDSRAPATFKRRYGKSKTKYFDFLPARSMIHDDLTKRTRRNTAMHIARESSRRGFMKMLVASPLLTQIAVRDLYEKSATALGFDPRGNVFSRLGVKTVINCRGTWTYLSGSLQFPEVSAAETEAAKYFVNMMELQRGVGRRLAELTGAESGIV